MIVSHANYLVSRGHDVTLQVHRTDTLFHLDPKVRIVPMNFGGKLGALLTALRHFGSYDRIIADIIPVALMLGLLNRQAVVYYAQDYDEAYYSKRIQQLFIRGLYYLGLSILKIRAITVSTRLAEIVRDRFCHRSIVVENGVDLGIFHGNPDHDLIGNKEGRFAILVFSRSDYRKGFDLSCEIIKRLSEMPTPSFEVWSVGEATQMLPESVRHRDFGYLSGEELARVLSSADIFLYPSRHEGFPLMVVEAFACGCPVVTTDAVCFAQNGKNSMVSPIGDVDALARACSMLLEDTEMRLMLSRNGLRFAREHSLHDTLKNFEYALQLNGTTNN